jgi:hypothetical protein
MTDERSDCRDFILTSKRPPWVTASQWYYLQEHVDEVCSERRPTPLDEVDGMLDGVVAMFLGMVVFGGLLGMLVTGNVWAAAATFVLCVATPWLVFRPRAFGAWLRNFPRWNDKEAGQ